MGNSNSAATKIKAKCRLAQQTESFHYPAGYTSGKAKKVE